MSAGPETLFDLPGAGDCWPGEDLSGRGATNVGESPRARRNTRAETSADFSPADLQVRLPEEAGWMPRSESYHVSSPRVHGGAEELAELDEEIEFRLAPEFPDLVLETQTIPGNIIEFPRELVASRKARPRLAEGPLRADGTPEPQLRIFEVEPAQISAEPEVGTLAEAPEWQGMLLGAGASAEHRAAISRQLESQLQLDQQIYAAPVARRVLAATIDGLCVGRGPCWLRGDGRQDCGSYAATDAATIIGGGCRGNLFVLCGDLSAAVLYVERCDGGNAHDADGLLHVWGGPTRRARRSPQTDLDGAGSVPAGPGPGVDDAGQRWPGVARSHVADVPARVLAFSAWAGQGASPCQPESTA